MKHLNYFILSLLTVLVFQACVIEERYHFHDDMSGEYTMIFDYSMLAEKDSSSEIKLGMDHMLDSLYDAIQFIDGISNAKKESEGFGFQLSYDFDGVDVLNQLDAMDEGDIPNKAVFKQKGKRLVFRPDFDDLKSSLEMVGEGEEEGETINDAEMAESLGQMFKVRTIISFDKKVKVKNLKYFKETEKNTFEYSSAEHGFNVVPELDVKL